jgi:hypothetical protein
VELTQKKCQFQWPVCEEISSERFFRPKSNIILILLI